MSAWEQVLASALVGTERRPPPPDALTVVGLDEPAAERPPEAALLTAAAALSVWRRAGFVPDTVDDVPPPAPDDGRRPPSAAAAQVLELLVTGSVWLPSGPGPLVLEWLEQAAANGWAVPPRLLPALLDSGVNDPRLIDVLGVRGRWLAAQDERWMQAFGVWADVEERFHRGTRVQRMQALRELRQRDPAEARELVEEVWRQEKAAERAELVKALDVGLSMDDEPFLEAALDDRAESVRQAAARLLARLPDSRRSRRMAERVAPLLSVGGRVRKKIEVVYPDEPDAAARRDGVTDDDPPAKTGLAAWWLVQLIAGAPLSLWEVELGLTPDEAVRLGMQQPEVILGWRQAAHAQRDGRWAAALFKFTRQADLLPAVPGAEAATLLESVLGQADDAAVARGLLSAPRPWGEPFSRVVLRRASLMGTPAVENVAHLLAANLDPAVAPEVERWALSLAGEDRARRLVRGIHHALTIRDTIRKELA